ncbi:MAG: adenylate/guanylate cyclase domain-containing protein [Acidobacteriota bacterium]
MSKNQKKVVASAVILVSAILGIALFSKYSPYLDDLELRNYDFMMAVVRGPEPPPKDIVIVAIDEASRSQFEQDYGVTYPWPRGFYGQLVDTLNTLGAKAVVFDVAFFDASQPDEDEAFASAIRRSHIPIVVAAAVEVVADPRFSMVRQLLPFSAFTDAGAQIGYATLNPDRDGVLRRGRLAVGSEPTLATRALQDLGKEDLLRQASVIGLEGGDPEILVNYVGGGRSIPTVSFYQAIDAQSLLPDGYFRDKIVFVGYSLAVTDLSQGSAPDHYPSPFDGLSGMASMPGVEIHANILNTILTGKYIDRLPAVPQWVILIGLAILVSLFVLLTERFSLKISGSLVLILAFATTSVLLFIYARVWLLTIQPIALMLLVFGLNILYQYRLTEKERAQIRRALSGYVSKQVMGEIMKHPDELELGGVQVEATVLFSDIAGFSKLSEKTTPRELATLLNDYFTRMGDIIMSREGMINKYIGDAIMAIWNAPLPTRAHGRLACEAALEMRRVVAQTPPIRMRVGINTGPMVAGNLGHRERMEYTVIGDSVNLASRLEGANKVFGTVILISETTEALVRDFFLLRQVDRIRVVGKERPVAVFEVMALRDAADADPLIPLVDSFSRVLDAYEARDWVRAEQLCEVHLDRFPGDFVTQTYLKRCQRFREAPPADDWDGVFTLEAK